jgi:hypothetical protein
MCRQRFERAILKLEGKEVVDVAFHGTLAADVTSNLQNGIDPLLGPGRFFSFDPMVAAHSSCVRDGPPIDGSNARDGEIAHIIVCLVILPKSLSVEPEEQLFVTNDPDHHIPIGYMQGVRMPDCFVLNNEKQLMLGRRYNNFHKRLQSFELPEQIDRVKRQILVDLQSKQPALASDLYRRYSDLLLNGGSSTSSETKREILARLRKFPKSVIAIKFPGLLEEEESLQMDGVGVTTTNSLDGNKIDPWPEQAQALIDMWREQAPEKMEAPDLERMQRRWHEEIWLHFKVKRE